MSKLRRLQPTKIFQLTALTMALALAGCGGGGSGPVDSIAKVPDGSSTNPDTPTNPNTGKDDDPINTEEYMVQLISPPSLIEMTQGSTAIVKVRVVDKKYGIVPKQTVTFSITDPELTGVVNSSSSSVVSDEKGEATITLEVPSKLTDKQMAYLKNTGVSIKASIDESAKSLVIKGTEKPVQIDTDYVVHLANNSPTMKTGSDSSTLVFRVLNEKGGIESGVPVTFELQPDPEAVQHYGVSFSSPASLTTNENGEVSIDLVQSNIGIDAQLDHEVDVILKINDVQEQKINIKVQGTTVKAVSTEISSSAPSLNDLVSIRGILLDGSGITITNADVELLNGTTVAAIGKTNDKGEFVFTDVNLSNLTTLTGPNGKPAYGFDLLVKGSKNIEPLKILQIASVNQVTSQSIAIDNACHEVIVGNKCEISVIAPPSFNGTDVRIVTTKGQFASGSNTATAKFSDGKATFSISSNSPGAANISAEALDNNETANKQIDFLSIDPAKLILQATKVELALNNTTDIQARVLDKDDAPIKNAWVQFTVIKDSSGGNLETGLVKTDKNGIATTTYAAGGNATQSGGVQIRAQIHSIELIDSNNKPTLDYSKIKDVVPVTVNLTVQTNASTITSGLSDKLSTDDNNVYYFRKGSIAVTNNGGQPSANQTVTMKLLPYKYGKGVWKYEYDPRVDKDRWVKYVYGVCDNEDKNFNSILDGVEDVNRNGKLDAGEDINGNGILDKGEDFNGDWALNPGFRATVLVDGQVVSGNNGTYILKTNSKGRVDFQIRYFKEYAEWMRMEMVVATSVDGSESSQSRTIRFPVLVDDIKTGDQAMRPNEESPFGTNTCELPK